MDPKALSHLDPKARETYDRVMGTASAIETPPQAQTAPTTPATDPGAPFNAVSPASDTPPTSTAFPVTPSDFSMDGLSAPTENQPASTVFSGNPVGQEPQNATSFFTNPSPNGNESTTPNNPFTPIEATADTAMATDTTNPPTPVTPYTPSGLNETMAPTGVGSSPFTQPLPSPAEVNHNTPHETPALMKVLYIVGAVVFFMIYTIFWIKVFNLPFLF